MADEIKDAKDGLKTLLETISGLRVIDHVPDSWNEFPIALILFKRRDANLTMGTSGFVGTMSVLLLLSQGNNLEAQDKLDEYMSPLGSNSIEAASDGDTTWGGAVDFARLRAVDNLVYQELWGQRFTGAEFEFEFAKSVATA